MKNITFSLLAPFFVFSNHIHACRLESDKDQLHIITPHRTPQEMPQLCDVLLPGGDVATTVLRLTGLQKACDRGYQFRTIHCLFRHTDRDTMRCLAKGEPPFDDFMSMLDRKVKVYSYDDNAEVAGIDALQKALAPHYVIAIDQAAAGCYDALVKRLLGDKYNEYTCLEVVTH